MSIDQPVFEGRLYPSPQPMRSPSPDLKSSNILSRTVTPAIHGSIRKPQTLSQSQNSPYTPRKHTSSAEQLNVLRDENYQLKRQLQELERQATIATPGTVTGSGTPTHRPYPMSSSFQNEFSRLKEKVQDQERQISKFRSQNQQYSKHNSQLQREAGEDLRAKLAEKDRVIVELKKVVASMSEDVGQSREDPNGIRQRIRCLEAENARLGQMVRRLNKKQNIEKIIADNKALAAKIELIAAENKDLQEKITRLRRGQSQEINDLIKVNNSLTLQLKSHAILESKIKQLESENNRLLRIIKESKEVQAQLEREVERLQNEAAKNQMGSSQPPPFPTTPTKFVSAGGTGEKMVIAKIKEQYNQSLRVFRQNVSEDVNKQLQRYQDKIGQMAQLLNRLEPKLGNLEQNLTRVQAAKLSRQVSQIRKPKTAEQGIGTPDKQDELEKLKEKYERELVTIYDQFETKLNQESALRTEVNRKYNQLNAKYNEVKTSETQKISEIASLILEKGKHRDQIERLQKQIEENAQRVPSPVRYKHEEEINGVRDSMQKQMEELVDQHQNEINQLRAVTEEQIAKLMETYEQEITVLNKNMAEKEIDIADLNSRLETQTKKNDQLSIQFAQAIATIDRQKEELRKEKEEVEKLYEGSLQQSQIIREEAIKTVEIANLNKDDAVTARDQARHALQEVERRVQELENQIATLNGMNEKYAEDVSKLQESRDALTAERNNLMVQVQKLMHKQQVQKQETDALNSELSSAKNQIEGLNTRLTDLEALNNRMQSFKELLEQMEGFPLEESLHRILDNISSIKTDNHSLQMSLTEAANISEASKLQIQKLNQKVIELGSQLELTNAELEFVRKSLEAKNRECLELSQLFADKYEEAESRSQAQTTKVLQSVVLSDFQEKQCDKLVKLYKKLIGKAQETLSPRKSKHEEEEDSRGGIRMSESFSI